MLTQHTLSRLWVAGLVCLLATSASAQERTANYSGQTQAPRGQVQRVGYFNGVMNQAPYRYHNAYAGYAPGYNVYPSNGNIPNGGYTAYGYSGGSCCWGNKCGCHHNCAACRADIGHRFRCSMAWLKPLTYWDAGCQTDIIALNPGYANPNDLNQGYAAQGYGGPVTIPQAPNVRSNFNYGWGLPSSRLTPTSVPYGY
ncbi:MAG: hypothetical protein JWN70_171 [Planctomycetaceae bacterium]|nr:hypothetical protein [Planctomycetaceae bacterium]